jgi:hypothetical protein
MTEPRAAQQISSSVEVTDRVRAGKRFPSHKAKTISGQSPYSHEEKQGMLAG